MIPTFFISFFKLEIFVVLFRGGNVFTRTENADKHYTQSGFYFLCLLFFYFPFIL